MTIRGFVGAIAISTAALGTALVLAPAAVAGPPYKNCTEAHKDGRYDIPRGDQAYRPALDRDNDGIACESY
ncbi:excalibur calcium-binding domain-containing protein [Mycobacterium kyorinense]|uniref:Calcium-binding protein n=1 Tax=Mycobacterium kyorinense TaxID=487514 RepID=A0A1X1XRK2_9MYCO|nr:excalibur calcium-binding domain-containing protein [Mycobacterium kyorinense]ORW01384.1 calcium-binding protein [Mycobacterium kyorinense]